MRPNSSFKLSKENKVFLSNVLDNHKRGELKRCLIESQLQSQIKPRVSKDDKEVKDTE